MRTDKKISLKNLKIFDLDNILIFLTGLILGGFIIGIYQKNEFVDKYNKDFKKFSKQCDQKVKKTRDHYKFVLEHIDKPIIDTRIKKEPYKYIPKTFPQTNTINHSDYERFENYLSNDNFSSAIDIYKKVLADNDKISYSNLLGEYIFKKYKKSYSLGRHYAKKALEIEPDNYYFLYIWMISDAKTKNYKSAITKTLELKNMYIPANNISQSVDDFYKSTTKNYFHKTLKSNNRNELKSAISFFDEIQEFDYSQQLKNKLNKLADKDEQKILAEDEKYKLSKLYDIQIPMKKRGKHYVIKAKINDNLNIKLMLDTGASGVSVKSYIMREYDFPIIKRDVVYNTANGQIRSNIYKVDKFTIEDIDLFNFNIGELKNYNSSYNDGLLGMSFLEKFNWEIDEKNSILFLNKM